MIINKGFLECGRVTNEDESYTPFYAVEPIIKYIPKDKIIWCPFDEEWSAYYRMFRENGYKVVRSSIWEEQNFFQYEPDSWDMIVSNPPFSEKDRVLERLYELNKPFAVLLPLTSLQGIRRFKSLRNGIQLLAFDKRICYHRRSSSAACIPGCPFPSAYFCRGILPENLILEELIQYNRPLDSA